MRGNLRQPKSPLYPKESETPNILTKNSWHEYPTFWCKLLEEGAFVYLHETTASDHTKVL